MKTPKEYTSKYKYYPTIPVKVVNSIIKEAQIEAYNEAIDNATKNAITSKKIYHTELDQDEWDLDSLWCNKHSILKLKK